MEEKKSVKVPKKTKNEARKGAILKKAKSIFAKKGFADTTVSEIAKEARVSEATIYEYFSTKEDLLFSIPSETISQYQKENEKLLEYIHGPKDKLKFYIYRRMQLYSEDPDYANIVMLNLKTNRKFIETDAYQIIRQAAQNTIRALEEGMNSGEFRSDIDPYLIRAMIWGTIEHLVVRKSLLGKPENLLPYAEKIADLIFRSIGVEKPQSEIRVHVTMEQKK